MLIYIPKIFALLCRPLTYIWILLCTNRGFSLRPKTAPQAFITSKFAAVASYASGRASAEQVTHAPAHALYSMEAMAKCYEGTHSPETCRTARVSENFVHEYAHRCFPLVIAERVTLMEQVELFLGTTKRRGGHLFRLPSPSTSCRKLIIAHTKKYSTPLPLFHHAHHTPLHQPLLLWRVAPATVLLRNIRVVSRGILPEHWVGPYGDFPLLREYLEVTENHPLLCGRQTILKH